MFFTVVALPDYGSLVQCHQAYPIIPSDSSNGGDGDDMLHNEHVVEIGREWFTYKSGSFCVTLLLPGTSSCMWQNSSPERIWVNVIQKYFLPSFSLIK